MGTEGIKRGILIILIVCSFFLIALSIKNMSDGLAGKTREDIFVREFQNAGKESNIVGFATHPVYGLYGSPENGFLYDVNNNLVTVSDGIIYRTGYYSVEGGAWRSFSLSGTAYGSSNVWLRNSASYSLPNLGEGEHYVIVYSCSYNNGWDCHGNKWQLQIINNTVTDDGSGPVINVESPSNNAVLNVNTVNIIASTSGTGTSTWVDMDRSVVGYWGMGSYSTSGVYDNSTNKNIGLFNGGMSTSNIVQGARGEGLSFDGVNDYLNAGNGKSLNITGQVTISAWVRFDSSTVRSTAIYGEMIVVKNNMYGLARYTNNRIGLYVKGTDWLTGTRSTWNTGEWYHIVGTADSSTGSIYINGVLDRSGSVRWSPAAYNDSLNIGAIREYTTQTAFTGAIDEVILFNRTLSAAEVRSLYDSQANKFSSSYSNLASGQHYYTVYAIDSLGNVAASGQRVFTIQSTGCIKNCAGRECGPDPLCNQPCGECAVSGEECVNGQCVLTGTGDGEIEQADYYVSINGDDDNPGTIDRPFASWQKAFDVAREGDLVYIRGGVYKPSGTLRSGDYYAVYVSGKGGTASNPIRIEAYPGETPILDGSNINQNGDHVGIYMGSTYYYNLKGLIVQNFKEYGQYPGCPLGRPFALYASHHIKIEQCTVRNSGDGFSASGKCDYIEYINCDSYNNADYSDRGGFANGFTLTMYVSAGPTGATGTHVTLTGCRSWNNSDDGYDLFGANGYFTFNNCWAWDNGWGPGGNGNGDGFKSEPSLAAESGVQRIYNNCLAWNNRGQGFCAHVSGDSSRGIHHLYNCVSYNNLAHGFGYNIYEGSVPPCIFRNNIAFSNDIAQYTGRSEYINDHNSWNGGVTVDANDFLSLDDGDADNQRKKDGSLPDMNFLKLRSGSDLIDAGVDVGLPFSGNKPDLGAFEYR